jgi:hypothetical protein
MNISIFARPHFIGKDLEAPGGPYFYIYRGSSLIRGEQVAKYIGAKYNPKSGYENDLCIYLKPKTLDSVKDGSYVDVSDAGEYLVEQLKNRLKIKVITSSQCTYEFVKERLKNDVVLIPEHHCNFERTVRSRKEINTVGFLGTPRSFTYPIDEMRKRMKKIGIEFITNFNYKNRQDVVDFYKQIDLQIVWYIADNSPFKHPGKFINAASFGIPSIANPQVGYKEFEGNYISIKTIDSLIVEVEKMKNKDYYSQWSSKIMKAAEKYHISKIAEKYKQLT